MSVRQRLLARYYDPIAATGLRETTILPSLLDVIATTEPRRILHLGCGRGWMTRALAARFSCEVVGLDTDADILAEAAPMERVRYVLGRAEDPPVEGPFDAIVSSLLLHHLSREEKRVAFARAKALLAPGGRLVTIDFGTPHDAIMRAAFVPVQLAHGFRDTTDNLDGSYLREMAAAGFVAASEVGRWRSPLGSVALYHASVV